MSTWNEPLSALALSLPTQRGVLEELSLGDSIWWTGLASVTAAAAGMALMVCLYELVFLRKERAAVRSELLGLDRARSEAEAAARLARLEPHFLFNSLNALGHLIAVDPPRAALFTEHLAALHRYLLQSSAARLVPLGQELSFLESYVALMTIRFGATFALRVEDLGARRDWLIPPTALQGLVENALKHNELSEAQPLQISIALGARSDAASVTVTNAYRPRRHGRGSLGSGLQHLDERARRGSGRHIAVTRQDQVFRVEVPLAEPGLVAATLHAAPYTATPLHSAAGRLR